MYDKTIRYYLDNRQNVLFFFFNFNPAFCQETDIFIAPETEIFFLVGNKQTLNRGQYSDKEH